MTMNTTKVEWTNRQLSKTWLGLDLNKPSIHPSFTEKDVKVLGELDASKLDPFILYINRFNEELEKNVEAGSNDSEKSLERTTA